MHQATNFGSVDKQWLNLTLGQNVDYFARDSKGLVVKAFTSEQEDLGSNTAQTKFFVCLFEREKERERERERERAGMKVNPMVALQRDLLSIVLQRVGYYIKLSSGNSLTTNCL